MTASTVTARRKGDPQHKLRGTERERQRERDRGSRRGQGSEGPHSEVTRQGEERQRKTGEGGGDRVHGARHLNNRVNGQEYHRERRQGQKKAGKRRGQG